MRKKVTMMNKSTSEDVLCPADAEQSSSSGQILSGQVVSSKVMEEALHLNLKLTPFESFPGDGSIFKAFFHGKVICTKVLSKVLPAVTFKEGEHDVDGNEKVVLQNDTLLSFSVIAREMISLRGDAGLDLDTDRTTDEKSVKPGQRMGDDRDCGTSIHSPMGDDCDSVGDINSGIESDRDMLTDQTKNDTMIKDTRQPCAVPAKRKPKMKRRGDHHDTSIRSTLRDNRDGVGDINSGNESDRVAPADDRDTKNDTTVKDTAKHICNECGKAFEKKEMLSKHQLTHEEYKYACSFGCRAFTRKERLVKHMLIHTRTRDHVCKICSKTFFDASSLESHQYVHSDDKPFKCTHCDRAYTTRKSLNKHISRVHPVFRLNTQELCASQKYTCSFGCGEFSPKYNFTKHMNIHTRTRDHKCKICSKAFFDTKSLDNHELVHSAEKPFKCTHCDKAYTMRKSLAKHVLRHQSNTKTYKCEICGKISFSKSMHRYHLQAHSNVKAFQCEVCGKQFGSKHNLLSHELMHKGYTKYQCDQCEKSYRSKPYLEIHKKTHTGENLLQCEVCGDWFSDPFYFKRHQRDYCKGKLKIQCEVCGQSFPNNRHLVSHMGLHSGERPFGCDVCGKAFAKPEGLADHVKRHNPETDFRCQYCGKFCINKSELGKHEALHVRRKRYARLPAEMKPGSFRSETTVVQAETSKPKQTSGAELGTPEIEDIVYSVTDTSGGNGDGGDSDQNPQPITIYVDDGVGSGEIPQSMTIYIEHSEPM